MIKNKFIKSTLLLLIGGFITKLLGMFIKIIITRYIGINGISLYMLIMPTYNLFIVLCQLGFPISISKLVAENKLNNKKIIISALYLSIFISFILILILFIFNSTICKFLHNSLLYFPILSIGFTLPFISISSIIRSYFFGKEKMFPHIFSNFIEQLVRIIMYIIVLPKLKKYSIIYSISFIIISNIVSELSSIIILYFFLPKKINISKEKIIPDFNIIKDILNISIPSTGSKIIGTIAYFFEPIILTTIMLKIGYSKSYIISEYGIITGYVFPLLLMPSFFSVAISQAILPTISKNNNKNYIKNKIKQALTISFLIGLFFTIIYMLFPKELMKFIFNTNKGINYLKVSTPFFLIQYIQSPIISIMQAINKSKESLKITTSGIILKYIILIILIVLNFKMYSLIISCIFNIIYVTFFNYLEIKKEY